MTSPYFEQLVSQTARNQQVSHPTDDGTNSEEENI
jgi:hypothetical protein